MLTLENQATARGLEQTAEVEGITEYRLDNGLQLLLFPDASRPTVTVNLTIFVGSRHEGYGEAGMAHLLEHMLFKGTPSHPEVPKVLQQRGAQFNGTTWYDRTNYYETLPASDENLEFALRLEADRMINSWIRGEDLASEMTVVRNEFERGENSPDRILSQRIEAVAYEWHNYGKSTIGNRSDIERVPIPKLRAFYQRFYQPDNAMLVIAGKFDEEQALEWVEQYFGSIPRPTRELDNTYTEEPPQDGERTVALRRVGDVGLVGVAYHIPASSHPEFAAVRVLSYILAMEPGGRLYKDLVESQKASSVSGYAFAFHDPGLVEFFAEVRKENSLEEVRKTLLATIEKLGDEGVTDEEVERAKQQILKSRELELADSSRLAVALSNWAAQGDWRLYFLYRDRIEQVTAADVKAAAQKYLRRNNRTVGLFIPTEKPERVDVPSRPDVAEMVRDYQGRESVASGEQFDASPANIEARTARGELPTGLKTALLPKKTRGEVVHLSLTLRYGNADNLKGFDTAADVLPELMTRGTQRLTHQQIQDELDKNRARLSVTGRRGVASFDIETKRQNLPAVLALLEQILREASLPKEELEVYRRQQLAELETAVTDPQYLASTELRRKLAPYPQDDVRYIPTLAEQIDRYKSLSLDKIKTLYDDYLGAQNGELTIVGDFAPEEVMPVINNMLDSWTTKVPYARVPEPAEDVPGSQVQIRTPDKANAAYYAGLMIPLTDADADYPALEIGNFILGGGSLSSRLGDRVRQKEGLSYGIGSGVRSHPIDKNTRLMIGAICNPENSPKLIRAIQEEIQRLLTDGITDEELARAKQGYLQQQQVQRTDDSRLTSILSSGLFVGRTMSYYDDLEQKISSLTTADVVGALRRHIDPQRLIVVTAGDFKTTVEIEPQRH